MTHAAQYAQQASEGDGMNTTDRQRLACAYEEGLDAVLDVVDYLLDTARHSIRGRCRYCLGAPKPGPDHKESCFRYRGVLKHEWVSTRINPTFGGVDYFCRCGGWFRQGGLAGHGGGADDAVPICPRAERTERTGEESAHDLS